MGWRRLCGVVLVVVAVLVGEGEEARRVEVEARNIQIQCGAGFF